MTTVDDHLDEVMGLQLVFKNPVLAKVCHAICEQACQSGEYQAFLWPDDVELSWLDKKDAACIGIAYRILSRTLKCIAQVEPCQRRRSHAKDRNGGMVFLYRVTDWNRCRKIARLGKVEQGVLL